MPILLFKQNLPVLKLRNDNFDVLLYQQILNDLPTGSILVVDSDQVFGLLYQQLVVQVRKEILILPATAEMRWNYFNSQENFRNLFIYPENKRLQRLADIIAWAIAKDKRIFLLDPDTRLFSFLNKQIKPIYIIPYGYTLEIKMDSRPVEKYDYQLSNQLANKKLSEFDFWNKGLKGSLAATHTLLAYSLQQTNYSRIALSQFDLALNLVQLPTNRDIIIKTKNQSTY